MKKKYVEVCAIFKIDGSVTPIWLKWENGKIYELDKVTDVRQAASLKAGGVGMRYTVKICGQTRFLFCEGQNIMKEHAFCKWFVEID